MFIFLSMVCHILSHEGGFVIKLSKTQCVEFPFHRGALILQQPYSQIALVSAGITMHDIDDNHYLLSKLQNSQAKHEDLIKHGHIK